MQKTGGLSTTKTGAVRNGVVKKMEGKSAWVLWEDAARKGADDESDEKVPVEPLEPVLLWDLIVIKKYDEDIVVKKPSGSEITVKGEGEGEWIAEGFQASQITRMLDLPH